MAFKPAEHSRALINDRREPPYPVALARVDGQCGLDSAFKQRRVKLNGLPRWGAPVERASGLQGGRPHLVGEEKRAAIKVTASLCARLIGEEQRVEVRDVARVMLGIPVRARRHRDRGGEALILSNQPGRHEPAVRSAGYANAPRIGDAPLDE